MELKILPATMVLNKKRLPRNNVVIGEDQAQIRLLERFLETEAVLVEKVTNESLISETGLLLRVYASHKIDLSSEISKDTGFWVATKIIKGSAAIAEVVKFAVSITPKPDGTAFTKDEINIVSDLLVTEEITDTFAVVWRAVNLLSSKIQRSYWKDPWDSPDGWFPLDKQEYRLNSLYRALVGYAMVHTLDDEPARKYGLSPSKIQRYKRLSLPLSKIEDTIITLSQWKQGGMLPVICALQISAIWASKS